MKRTLCSADLLEAARMYLDGKCDLATLNGISATLADAFRMTEPNSQDLAWAETWNHMVNRRWNEMGEQVNPITEAEFRAWIVEQLRSECT